MLFQAYTACQPAELVDGTKSKGKEGPRCLMIPTTEIQTLLCVIQALMRNHTTEPAQCSQRLVSSAREAMLRVVGHGHPSSRIAFSTTAVPATTTAVRTLTIATMTLVIVTMTLVIVAITLIIVTITLIIVTTISTVVIISITVKLSLQSTLSSKVPRRRGGNRR
jgi:hypothetical protein